MDLFFAWQGARCYRNGLIANDLKYFDRDPPIDQGVAMYGDFRSKDLFLSGVTTPYMSEECKIRVIKQTRRDLVFVFTGMCQGDEYPRDSCK